MLQGRTTLKHGSFQMYPDLFLRFFYAVYACVRACMSVTVPVSLPTCVSAEGYAAASGTR